MFLQAIIHSAIKKAITYQNVDSLKKESDFLISEFKLIFQIYFKNTFQFSDKISDKFSEKL